MRSPNLWSVNWKDGMLITQEHLSRQEKYGEELIQWLSFNTAGGYGLVSNQAYTKETLEVIPELKENKLIVTIESCGAITPGGQIININRENQDRQPVAATLDVDPAADQTMAVYISADSESKKEVGDPIPSEEPPRVPYTTFKYGLHIGGEPSLPEGTWMQIAELILGGNQVALSEDYIPPCLTVSSSRVLYSAARRFRNTLENLLKLSSQAFVAFSAPGESFELQDALCAITQQASLFLASSLDSQPPIGAHHPSQLIVYYRSLLRFFSSLFELYPQVRNFLKRSQIAEKEESFFSQVESFLREEYHHGDLRSHVSSIRGLLQAMEEILIFIAELSPARLAPFARILEYRGEEYSQLSYDRCHFTREGDLHYLTVEGVKAEPLRDVLALVRKSLFSPEEYDYIDVRIGINEAKTLGKSDPGEVDTRTVGDRIVFSPVDRLENPEVRRITLIFRGPMDYSKLFDVSTGDVQVYGM